MPPDPPISFCTSCRSSYKHSVPMLCPSNGEVLATPLVHTMAVVPCCKKVSTAQRSGRLVCMADVVACLKKNLALRSSTGYAPTCIVDVSTNVDDSCY